MLEVRVMTWKVSGIQRFRNYGIQELRNSCIGELNRQRAKNP